MKHTSIFVPALALSLALISCTDTTGLNATLSKGPHPKSNPNGAVVVAEFADLQCPACRSAHTDIVQPLIEKHGALIRYEFHHFPLRSLHRFALSAAEAAECAADQGKFWEYVNHVYAQQEKLSRKELRAWAQELSLNMDLFDRCIKSQIKRDAILDEYEAGQTAGVRGTPTFFVNGQRVEASIEAISAAVEGVVRGAAKRL